MEGVLGWKQTPLAKARAQNHHDVDLADYSFYPYLSTKLSKNILVDFQGMLTLQKVDQVVVIAKES